jgi:hypothetical protein
MIPDLLSRLDGLNQRLLALQPDDLAGFQETLAARADVIDLLARSAPAAASLRLREALQEAHGAGEQALAVLLKTRQSLRAEQQRLRRLCPEAERPQPSISTRF